LKRFNNPEEILHNTALVDSFLTLIKIDTQSDPTTNIWPSTPGQLNLLDLLKGKLQALGCTDIVLDQNGYLFATFPGNVESAPVIGLLAHVDTAPDFSGKDVQPVLHYNYNGSAITLSNGLVIAPEDNPELKECLGDTIITADGRTLLGADDKAGVAEILAVLEMLRQNETQPRPTLRIGFTPDEEIGNGPDRFDLPRFNAHAAYTVDGGFTGEINFETFCADGAKVIFTGVAVHPGYAKDKMVNALRYLGAFLDRLPKEESPERTEKRQGFFHPIKISGNAAEATAELILRDFEEEALADRGRRLQALVTEIGAQEPRLKTETKIEPTYRNMAIKLRERAEVREKLEQAVQDAGITPVVKPIRGGTDGSGLTAGGLPTPNIFAGGVQVHGPREWVSIRVMAQAVCTMLNLVQRWAE